MPVSDFPRQRFTFDLHERRRRMRLNLANYSKSPRVHLRTHEGAPAVAISPEQALRRSVLSCMLWEGEFYEDGVQIAGRIRELVPQVGAETVAALAVEA